MIVAIIQARMGSKRLPGKVLKKVDDQPLLKYMVERVRKSLLIDKVVIATTTLKQDDIIMEFCDQFKVEHFRGNINDLVSRYFECATKYSATTIVRLTSDCPLIDPIVIDEVITLFKKNCVDYASNTNPPKTNSYPAGTDVSVFRYKALSEINTTCTNPYDREHITFCFFYQDAGYKTIQLLNDKDYSMYRFTVDYSEDLEVVEYLLKEIKKKRCFGYVDEIISLIDSNEYIKTVNAKWVGLEKYWF